jgi:hypothetical protein
MAYTHTETEAYRLEIMRNGLYAVLTRKHDGADVCLQGDAATQAITEADELAECWANNDAKAEEFFNYWASQYDDVMEKRA